MERRFSAKINVKNVAIPQKKPRSPWAAIILFAFVILVAAFYDSAKVIVWETQGDGANSTPFQKAIVAYAGFAEQAKKALGLENFFERDAAFWRATKQSPVVFGDSQPDISSLSAASSDGSADGDSQPVIEAPAPAPVSAPAANDNPNIKPEVTVKGNASDNAGKSEEKKEKIAKQAIAKVEPPKPEISATSSPVVVTETATSSAPVLAAASQKTVPPSDLVIPPLNVLIIGDSFVAVGGGLGDPLERTLLNYKGLTVHRLGKVSSGLARADYFNWLATAQDLGERYSPNVVIMMFGSNDTNAVTAANGAIVAGWGSAGWDAAYRGRIDAMVNFFEKKKALVFAVGSPIMKKKDLSASIAHINALYQGDLSTRTDAHFISIWNDLCDKAGNYTDYLPDQNGLEKLARTPDGVHLQYFAGYLISQKIVNELKQYLKMDPK